MVLNKVKTHYNLECVFIEPGRSIVGEAGITLYECGTIKRTYGGKNFLFVDGGMTDNIRPALYSALYTVDVVNRINEPKTVTVDIAGKCCESGDIIAHNQLIPETTPGDILVVYDTGAYTYSYYYGSGDVTLTETTVSLNAVSQFKFRSTTYYWIAIV